MLHYESIDSETLALLNSLLAIPHFTNLRLVRGTSLALQIGHRKSIDIDLFGELSIDELELTQQLKKLGSLIELKKSENIHIYAINNIKVDIVNYPYTRLENPILEEGLVLAAKKKILQQ